MWPDRRLTDLFKIEHPIVQAPMAGAMDVDLAAAVAEAGGLGSLPCGMLAPEQLGDYVKRFRDRCDGPVNLNFFTHATPVPDNVREVRWRERLAPYYRELGVDAAAPPPQGGRAPFNAAALEAVLAVRPEVVSFHYGLPAEELLMPLRKAGIVVVGCATTVAEARWLEQRGADAVIAQGFEAGGHRGIFLSSDIATQVGTFALVPQIADAVKRPVIAAGGIADARGITAAFALGASGVQIGSAYLQCPEAKISAPYRAALATVADDGTVLTNVISGRPARAIVTRLIREVGPISPDPPAFPLAAAAVMPLRAKAEAAGSGDFSPLLAGQAAGLGRAVPAAELTRVLAAETKALIGRLARA